MSAAPSHVGNSSRFLEGGFAMKALKTEKGKKPRVLANTIKRSEKSLNSSGNKSFFNKSTNHYITDLRNNNAKLAHSLANEKLKVAEVFRRYTECQALQMGQKTLLRSLDQSIKTGMQKFSSGVEQFNIALDLMFQGTSLLGDVRRKIATCCPELAETTVPLLSRYENATSLTPNRLAAPSHNGNSTVTSNLVGSGLSPERALPPPTTTVSTVRQCAAKPMVKGQIISKPTISLERVNVPTQLGKGPFRGQQVCPERGGRQSRLSDVVEELNDSNVCNLSSGPAVSLAAHSPSSSVNSRKSLPSSHVVLERMSLDYMCAPDHPSTSQRSEEDDQLTVVHFGSLNFCDSAEILTSPKDLSAPKSPTVTKKDTDLQDISKSAHNSSGEYLSESSSEDEDLALQIVESKKSYLERQRQVDSKEGTSWNYDAAGKFHKQPPKKRKKTKSSQSLVQPVKSRAPKRRAEEHLSQARELRAKQSLNETVLQDDTTFAIPSSPKGSCNNNDDSIPMTSVDQLSKTVLEEEDMSFTCCTSSNRRVPMEMPRFNSPNEENEALLESGQDQVPTQMTEQPSFCERKVYVTQRQRYRKPFLDNSTSHDLYCSLSPVSSPSSRRTNSQAENNENSPPGHASSCDEINEESRKTGSTVSQDLSRLPNVVLERLPMFISYGSSLQLKDGCLEGARSSATITTPMKNLEVPNKFEATSCDPPTDNFLSTSMPSTSPIFTTRKGSLSNSASNRVKVSNKDESRGVPNKSNAVPKPRSKKETATMKTSMCSDKSPKVSYSKPGPTHLASGKELNSVHESKEVLTQRKSKPETEKAKEKKPSNGDEFNSDHDFKEVVMQRKSKTETEKALSAKEKKVQKSLEGLCNGATLQSMPPTSSSAPTSPNSAINGNDTLSEIEKSHRLRRNVAPTSYKEPKCNKKLRRP